MVGGRNIEPGNDGWTIKRCEWMSGAKLWPQQEDLINFSPMRRRSLRRSLRTPFSLRPVICLLEAYKIGQVQPPKGPLPPFLFLHTPPAQTDVYCFCSVKRPQLSCVCMRWWGAWLRYGQYVSGMKAWLGKKTTKQLLSTREGVGHLQPFDHYVHLYFGLLMMHLGADN